jgi:hypothetical protein
MYPYPISQAPVFRQRSASERYLHIVYFANLQRPLSQLDFLYVTADIQLRGN